MIYFKWWLVWAQLMLQGGSYGFMVTWANYEDGAWTDYRGTWSRPFLPWDMAALRSGKAVTEIAPGALVRHSVRIFPVKP